MISVEADDDAAPKVARRLSDLAGMLEEVEKLSTDVSRPTSGPDGGDFRDD